MTGEYAILKRRYVSLVIGIFVLIITYLHFSTLPAIYAFHNIYKEFYYIPIFIGALVFGLRAHSLYIYVFLFSSSHLFLMGGPGPLRPKSVDCFIWDYKAFLHFSPDIS